MILSLSWGVSWGVSSCRLVLACRLVVLRCRPSCLSSRRPSPASCVVRLVPSSSHCLVLARRPLSGVVLLVVLRCLRCRLVCRPAVLSSFFVCRLVVLRCLRCRLVVLRASRCASRCVLVVGRGGRCDVVVGWWECGGVVRRPPCLLVLRYPVVMTIAVPVMSPLACLPGFSFRGEGWMFDEARTE